MYSIDCSIEGNLPARADRFSRNSLCHLCDPTTDNDRAATATRRSGKTAGTAAPGSFATRPCTSWRFFSTRPFASRAPSIRFGLDGIIGLVPGLGDVLAGLLSLIIPLAAWIRGVPYVTLVRMAANLGIGVLVGSIPLFGDIFDIAWKANRRNYRLLVPPPGRAAPPHLAGLDLSAPAGAVTGAGLRHSRGAGGVALLVADAPLSC